jgi:hypothetical protein
MQENAVASQIAQERSLDTPETQWHTFECSNTLNMQEFTQHHCHWHTAKPQKTLWMYRLHPSMAPNSHFDQLRCLPAVWQLPG